MSNSPAWRQMFDSWEKAVSPGLQDLTASSGFRDVVAMSAKVNASVSGEVERASRRWLHLWNIPAASDIRNLRRQISSLEREVRSVKRTLEAERAGAAAPPATKAPASKPAATKPPATKPAAATKRPAAKRPTAKGGAKKAVARRLNGSADPAASAN